MHIEYKNRNVRMNGRTIIKGGRLLNMKSDKIKEDSQPQYIGGQVMLSKEVAGVVGGITNNRQVLTKNDIINMNRIGSGFSSLQIKPVKKSRNNLKFNLN
jgi:hypothetical protein